MEAAVNIARNHHHLLKWIQTPLLLKNMTLQSHRHVNLWNAFLKAKISKTTPGRDQGERVHLTEYVAKKKNELLEGYKKHTADEQQVFIDDIQAARNAETPIVRADPKAISNTVSAAFATMDCEWTSLCAKTSLKGFYVAVHGSVEDLSAPQMSFTTKAETFTKKVLDIEPHHLALKLESWVVSGINELDFILTEKRIKQKVQMNYNNYKQRIVERYGIALMGWPLDGHVKNPGKLHRADLEKVIDALQKEKCRLVKLSKSALAAWVADNKARQAHGEQVYKP
ncbi:hypothetical protein JVT61DRAFT_11468 [Boletus reticuloceps]|uniref:Uncharacterized protein n=1 Tax=Boletus reticuloceps TaxID=495285 RepID=A0A8I2YTQ4_9AGAM|nr:hypothetical protein JVT61DRAFT_11468 [Boletus reticuloceps]